MQVVTERRKWGVTWGQQKKRLLSGGAAKRDQGKHKLGEPNSVSLSLNLLLWVLSLSPSAMRQDRPVKSLSSAPCRG